METDNLIAEAQTTIEATIDQVWDALINPVTIKKYMFGTNVTTDWSEGSKIIWKGEWKGKPYEDHGSVLQFKPKRLLQYTHFSPLMGHPDVPENYHTVTIELMNKENKTHVTLIQDNNATEEEKEHSQQNWEMMLTDLKKLLET